MSSYCKTVILVVGLSSSPLVAQAADLRLTKQMLDQNQGFVDFLAEPHTLGPGDRVLIEGHTRYGLILVNLTSNNAAAPIVVTNDVSGTNPQPFVINQTANPIDKKGGIHIWGAQNVVFRGTPVGDQQYGIKVASAPSMGIDIDYNQYQRDDTAGTFMDTKNLEISNVEIANTGFAGIRAKYNNTAITYPSTALLDGLHIHHNFIHDTDGEGMYLGWTSDGHPDVANVRVHHNLLRQTGWDGIQVNRSRGTNVIHDNVVEGYAVKAVDATGTRGDQNEGITTSASKIDIYNNTVKASSPHSGSALFFVIYDVSKIYNNVFVHGGSFGGTQHDPGIYIKQDVEAPRAFALSGATLDLLNNTIVKPDHHGITVNAQVVRPVALRNTVIVQPLNGGTYVSVQSGATPPTDIEYRHYATMAEAGFVSDTDYHLAAESRLIDTGVDTSGFGVTTDRDGVTRPQGSGYDIGAYERVATPTPTPTPTPVLTVLTPAGTGTATGSQFCSAVAAFNAQPTWNATAQAPEGNDPVEHSGTDTAYANRFWYVDFGADWAKVRITATWTRYRPWSGGTYAGFPALWWDDDNDTVNDGTSAAALNFTTAQNLSHVVNQQWVRDRQPSTPVTPAGRYLVVSTGASPTDRANEFAFIGYRVP